MIHAYLLSCEVCCLIGSCNQSGVSTDFVCGDLIRILSETGSCTSFILVNIMAVSSDAIMSCEGLVKLKVKVMFTFR